MDADAKLNAALGRKAGIALDHAILHFDGAAHRINYATELYDSSVAGALHHATVMHGNGWIDQIATESPEPRQYAVLVGTGKLAISDDVRHQNCCEFTGLAHDRPPLDCYSRKPLS